jgi:uncharacterized protein YgiM (DUF1202 family)
MFPGHIEGVMMNRSRTRKVLRTLFAATSLAAAGVCFAQATAQEIVYAKQAVPIREGKSGFANVVVTTKKNDKLTVLAREDKWLKVQLGDKQGYVFENAISDKKVGSGQGFGNAMAGGDSASGLDTSAAFKGLDENAEIYAKNKNMNPKVVDAMIARNTAIADADRVAFMKEGKVGSERK